MKPSSGMVCLGTLLITTFSSAANWNFTQVINDVRVVELPTQQSKRAAVDQIFQAPNVIRTGPASRAELVTDDKTLTRIGANSIVSFDATDRTLHLEQGSLLFNAPKAKGARSIRTRSAVASVLGTTIIVSATENGGMKVLLMEGSGRVTLPKGRSMKLNAGQVIFILPNNGGLSPVFNFKLEDQVQGSQLVNGFPNPLPSLAQIESHISRQNKLIASGQAVDTGLLVGDSATGTDVQVVDANVLQRRFQQVQAMGEFNVIRHSDVVINQFLDRDGRLNYSAGAAQLLANNIFISGTTIDLSSFAGTESLFLEATDTIEFAGTRLRETAFIGGANGVQNLHLIADNLIIPGNDALSFDGRSFTLEDLSDMTLSGGRFGMGIGVNRENGHLALTAAGNMSLGNVSLSGHSLSLAANNLAIGGANPGESRLTATSSLSIQAAEQIWMSNVDIGAQFLSISAKTVVLQSVNFPANSSVHLTSERGQLAANPNTGASVQPGYVNFVWGVTYGGAPAENAINNGIYLFAR
ncbi:MAG: FecR domain-containing protein [Verrucomicrobia bacterium]|nr:FecR domain-containing protein [Verrucomicrobiota bacterium]